MYIWSIEVEEHWNYDQLGDWSNNHGVFTVTAENANKAFTKVRDLCLRNTAESDDGSNKVYKCTDVRLIYLERKRELDA